MAYRKRSDFLESEEGAEVKRALKLMVTSEVYNTTPGYTTNTEEYPDNVMPFVDKHLHYLRNHPSVDSQQYLSNLRLMTRKR